MTLEARDADLLRHLRAVATSGSLRGAAKALGYQSSATVKLAIDTLEHKLDMTLLHRSTAGVSLTIDGQRMVRAAEAVLDSIEALNQLTVKQDGASDGVVCRVGTVQGAWLNVVERAGEAIDADVLVSAVSQGEPYSALISGQFDYVICGGVSDHEQQLLRMPVFTEPVQISSRAGTFPSSPDATPGLAGEIALTLADTQPWFTPPTGESDRRFTEYIRCDDARPGPPPFVAESSASGADLAPGLWAGHFIIPTTESVRHRFGQEGVDTHLVTDVRPYRFDLVSNHAAIPTERFIQFALALRLSASTDPRLGSPES